MKRMERNKNLGSIQLIRFLILIISHIFYSSFAQKSCNCPGGATAGKGTFYGYWGYNKDYFGKSDIRFSNSGSDNYDFTLYSVKATDRPNFNKIFKVDLTIPQYNCGVGYYFNNKYDLGVEISFDHVKYVVDDYQTLRVKGTIHGVYYDKDTIVEPSKLVHIEHTDGANFLMLNGVKRQQLLVSKDKKHWLSAIVKAGAGIVVPRTDVTMFGTQLNNRFHVAGYVVGANVGLRYDFLNYFFLESTVKVAFANYLNALAIGTGRINHSFFCGEIILLAGFQFPW